MAALPSLYLALRSGTPLAAGPLVIGMEIMPEKKRPSSRNCHGSSSGRTRPSVLTLLVVSVALALAAMAVVWFVFFQT